MNDETERLVVRANDSTLMCWLDRKRSRTAQLEGWAMAVAKDFDPIPTRIDEQPKCAGSGARRDSPRWVSRGTLQEDT